MLGSVVRGSQSAESLLSREDTTVLGGEQMAILVTCKRTPNTLACSTGRSSPGNRVETRRLRSNAPKFMAPISGIQSFNFPESDHSLSNGSGATAAFDRMSPLRAVLAVPVTGLSAQQSTNPVCLEV